MKIHIFVNKPEAVETKQRLVASTISISSGIYTKLKVHCNSMLVDIHAHSYFSKYT